MVGDAETLGVPAGLGIGVLAADAVNVLDA
jgi:hypothetical protein